MACSRSAHMSASASTRAARGSCGGRQPRTVSQAPLQTARHLASVRLRDVRGTVAGAWPCSSPGLVRWGGEGGVDVGRRCVDRWCAQYTRCWEGRRAAREYKCAGLPRNSYRRARPTQSLKGSRGRCGAELPAHGNATFCQRSRADVEVRRRPSSGTRRQSVHRQTAWVVERVSSARPGLRSPPPC